LRNRTRYGARGDFPAWQLTLGELMVEKFDPDAFVSREALLAVLPDILDGYLRFWSEANGRVLAHLAELDAITVHTKALSASLPPICEFLAVSADALVPEAAHANRADAAAPLLATLDRDFLRERAARHCGALMAELFPTSSNSLE